MFKEQIIEKIKNKRAVIGVIGLGYVGLPLSLHFVETGFKVLGFDIDSDKVQKLNQGETYIKHICVTEVLFLPFSLCLKSFILQILSY